MKKIKITLLAIVLTLGVNAQSVQKYTIDTTGSSNGMTIASGFEIAVITSCLSGVDGSDSLCLKMELTTIINDSTIIFINDQFNDIGFNSNVKSYIISGATTQSLDALTNYVQSDLNEAYGVLNVVKQ